MVVYTMECSYLGTLTCIFLWRVYSFSIFCEPCYMTTHIYNMLRINKRLIDLWVALIMYATSICVGSEDDGELPSCVAMWLALTNGEWLLNKFTFCWSDLPIVNSTYMQLEGSTWPKNEVRRGHFKSCRNPTWPFITTVESDVKVL